MTHTAATDEKNLQRERWRLLRQISAAFDKPMTALSFVWLGLLILDFTQGLSRPLEILNYVIWGLFGLQFGLEFWLAPRKWIYLRNNWLTAIALLLPAFRLFRVLRAFRVFRLGRAARSVGVLRLITSLNRGMRAVGRWMGRRGFGYAVAVTVLVTFGGAAGMYQCENPAALRDAGFEELANRGQGLHSYGEALWWTAMIMTTMGSEYWPKTTEGRVLSWLLALYAFAIFGYITATIASLFVGRDQELASKQPATSQQIAALRAELALLTSQLATLQATLAKRE